jgi:hypothetical protein
MTKWIEKDKIHIVESGETLCGLDINENDIKEKKIRMDGLIAFLENEGDLCIECRNEGIEIAGMSYD